MPSFIECVILAMIVTVSFSIRGATGFGSGAVAVPLAALVMPAQLIIPIINNLQLVSNTHFTVQNWRFVQWRETFLVVPYAAVGVMIGLYLFAVLDAKMMAKGLGVFVITYAMHTMITARDVATVSTRPPSLPVTASLSTAGGLAGALFGGATSVFIVLYLKSLHLRRGEFRSTITMIILTLAVMRMVGYVGLGRISIDSILLSLFLLPFMGIGAWFGNLLADRVSPLVFNRIVGVVLLVSGVGLIAK